MKMENFKYDNFKNLYGIELPVLNSNLIPDELRKGLSESALKLGYDNIYFYLENVGEKVSEFNASEGSFSFRRLISHLSDCTPPDLNIIWDLNSSHMDSIPFDLFCQYFDDIWYEIIDDIIVYNLDCNLLIFIRHDGCIFVLQDLKIYLKAL